MSTVDRREILRRRIEFVIKGRGWGSNSAVVGDVEQAVMDARALYKEVVGGKTDTDDWLGVTWADDELVFWFEVDEQVAQRIDAKVDELVRQRSES
jgi:hypothetical protein